MAGLLDPENRDSLMQGLLAFGGQTLANNTGHYGAFGPAIGPGISAFGNQYFGAQQQKKDNEERNRRLMMLEKMQNSQIAENDSQNAMRKAQLEQQQQAIQTRQGVFGELFGSPKPAPAPSPAKVAPDPMSGAQIQIPSQMPMPQGTPIAENEVAPVEVNAQAIPPLRNPYILRQMAARLAAGQDKEGAAFVMQLATAAESELNREEDKGDKTFTDNQGIVRYLKSGQPVANQQPKAPEGMQYGEDGQLNAIPGFLGMKKEIAAAGKPDVNVAVNSKEQTEEAKAVGKFQGEQYADIQKAGFNAQAKIDRFNRLDQLLEGVSTGKLTPVGTDLAAYAKSVGINMDDKLPNKEAATALINAMALELRNPAGGAGMPGAMSDADREYLRSMVPSLGNTPEGRKQLVDTGRKMAQREKDVARLAREYRKKNGGMDEGFYEVLEEFSAKNPLFDKPATASSGWSIKKK